MTATYDADVLVVGLGPTGDVMAALLALEGLSVIAVEREAGVFLAPRAAVFDDEVMRIFQSLGVAHDMLEVCRSPERYEFVTAAGDVLLDFVVEAETERSGWAQNYVLHQPAVERILRRRMATLSVDARSRTALVEFSQGAEGVTCRLGGPEGDYTLNTRWLVGCDGASSLVRSQLGTPLFDYGFDEPWLVIDAVVPDAGDLPQRLMQICDPRRPVTYLKMCGDRYRWEFMIKPGEDPAAVAGDEGLRALLAPWNCLDRMTIERRAVYRFHGLVAETWREGRVLLAGDAAHQMPPFAGQGLCAGVRDAANLAWKLGSVVRGQAPESLLDSYQAEREGHVRVVIETAIAMGRVVCLLDEEAAAGRDAQMLARKAAGETDIALAFPDLSGGAFTDLPGAGALFPQFVTPFGRLDDDLGPGAWLICRGPFPALGQGARVLSLDEPALAPFADKIGAWLDTHGAEAVLVRPDRHVFGAGAADVLAERWRTLA